MCPTVVRGPELRRGLGLLALTAVLSSFLYMPAGAQTRGSGGTPGTMSPELAHAKALLDKYQDPVLAVHDGYFSTVGCIEYPNGGGHGTMQYAPGGMGVHFLNLQLIGPALDPAKPQVLIYEPDGDKLKLVAAEWFLPATVVGQTKPTIFGRELQGPMEGHQPLMPQDFHHYDLHVWLWKDNPAGVFSATNPAVKCPGTGYSFAEAAPKLVKHEGH